MRKPPKPSPASSANPNPPRHPVAPSGPTMSPPGPEASEAARPKTRVLRSWVIAISPKQAASIGYPRRYQKRTPGRFQESTYLPRNRVEVQEPIEGFFKSQEQARNDAFVFWARLRL